MDLLGKQTMETFALFLIGDGVASVLQPRRHAALWRAGPGALQKFTTYFEQRPALSAVFGVAEIGIGLWLAHRQQGRPPLPAVNRIN
ncbi:MAG: hypothetical protein ABW199_06205 [Caulobacterales bacterium]